MTQAGGEGIHSAAARPGGEDPLSAQPASRERVGVRALAAGESSALAETLALAFRDNPMNQAAIRGGPERRLRANRCGIRGTLAAATGRSTILVTPPAETRVGERIAGGLIALPPGAWPLPPPALLAQIQLALGQGMGTVRRWGKVYRRLAQFHPREPHWYLLLLGVGPAGQRRGVGSALLETWLREVDRGGASAYLETDRRENVAFYQRAGFEVLEAHEILETPIWRMVRPAGALSS
ncbi:MAG: GNAT family N-acetyltransferase [Myxococcota bacterium]|nr:GNAT family N-acetyltransferase [Myxococcota bacterium]